MIPHACQPATRDVAFMMVLRIASLQHGNLMMARQLGYSTSAAILYGSRICLLTVSHVLPARRLNGKGHRPVLCIYRTMVLLIAHVVLLTLRKMFSSSDIAIAVLTRIATRRIKAGVCQYLISFPGQYLISSHFGSPIVMDSQAVLLVSCEKCPEGVSVHVFSRLLCKRCTTATLTGFNASSWRWFQLTVLDPFRIAGQATGPLVSLVIRMDMLDMSHLKGTLGASSMT